MRMRNVISLFSVLATVSVCAISVGALADQTKMVDAADAVAKPAAKEKAPNKTVPQADPASEVVKPQAPAPVAAGNGTDAKSAAAASGDDSVENTTVTARRRNELLRDIPGAAQVISGDDMDKRHITDTRELLEQIPGAQAGLSGADYADDIEMRGQGSGRNNLPIGSVSETSTAIYRNGNYIAGGNFNGRQLGQIDFFDISRIEILMGPQGALYGRNAVGGAINGVSRHPDMAFSARENVTYGTNDSYKGQAIVNVPLDEANGVAARLGAFTNNQLSGFVRNLQTGNKVDWNRNSGGRIGVQVAPNDEFKIWGALEFYHTNQPAYAQYGYEPLLDTPGQARNPYVRNNMNSEGRAIGDQRAAFLAVDKTTKVGDVALKLYGRGSNGVMMDNDYDHEFALNSQIAITTFGGPTPPNISGSVVDQRQSVAENFNMMDAELTLASNKTSRLKYLFGLQSTSNTDYQHTYFGACPTDGTFTTANKLTAAAIPAGCSPGFFNNQTYLNVTRYAALGSLRTVLADQQNTENLNSYALFSSLSFDLTKRLSLGVEYRYQVDSKTLDFQKYTTDPNTYYGNNGSMTAANLFNTTGLAYVPIGFTFYCPPYLSGCGYSSAALAHGAMAPTLVAHRDARWNVQLPAVTLQYHLNGGNQIYYRWATGYRPGGFNSPAQTSIQQIYNPERSASHEVGFKGKIFRKLDVTADVFYQTTRDVQVIDYDSNVYTYYLYNAGDAYSMGAEASVSTRFKFGRGLIATSIGLSSNYGRYYNSPPVSTLAGVVNISSNRLPHTRNLQGAYNLDYLFRLPWALGADVGGSWNFASGGNEDAFNAKRYNGYGTLNLRAGVVSTKGILLTAFAKNVLDRRYEMLSLGSNNDGTTQYWSQPMTVGVSLTLLQ